ncbi:MAG TPA: DUF4253 domain-containing protein [Rhizomicrobium sp.]|jgi:hypothetical protein|nr:DUF4253 domain-containing protein [Rhizomicrobium sp.]
MRRRIFIAGLGSALSVWSGRIDKSKAVDVNEFKRRAEEYKAKALANFPFKLIEIDGSHAYAKWEGLKRASQGTPVIIGGDENSFGNLLMPFGPNGPRIPSPPGVETILTEASRIHFPDDLIAKRKADDQQANENFRARLAKRPELFRDETLSRIMEQPHEPPVGEWPKEKQESPGLTVLTDLLKGTPLPKVRIALIPTTDWTTIPAYLHWGGWNDCPPPEYHVAAFRTWRDRYGAELVGLSSDTLNLRVQRRPSTREEALSLAREQYVYCSDIVEQGTRDYSTLAATLMDSDWWFFWWD